jgi:hypothetical protein
VIGSALTAVPDQAAPASAAELADDHRKFMAQHQDLEFLRRGRASSQMSANTFRTARYANDQSKWPLPSTRQQSAEPSQMAVGGAPGSVCEPYALLVLARSVGDEDLDHVILDHVGNAAPAFEEAP